MYLLDTCNQKQFQMKKNFTLVALGIISLLFNIIE